MSTIEQIARNKIIAVIRLNELSEAIPLSRALIAGGVNILEFTLTYPDAPRAIADVRNTLGDKAVVGAGSVISVEQVAQLAACDAEFVISPVLKYDVIESCHEYDLPVVPGAFTPTEIQSAWEMNVAAVKVFPARSLGTKYIKDILAPLPHLNLIPTGGINVSNIKDYIDAGVFAVGVGGALCGQAVIANGDWASISATSQELSEAIS